MWPMHSLFCGRCGLVHRLVLGSTNQILPPRVHPILPETRLGQRADGSRCVLRLHSQQGASSQAALNASQIARRAVSDRWFAQLNP